MPKNTVVICTQNTGYEASLEVRKLYEALPDQGAKVRGQVRVIDEAGEDYLYPESFFTRVNLTQEAMRQIFGAAR